MYGGPNSPWPTLMPPESEPALLKIRLLAICRKCAQPWTKMPPPPWELLVTLNPSMLDGLQMKLLGYGLGPELPVLHAGLLLPTTRAPLVPGAAPGLLTGTPVSSVVPTGKSASVVLNGSAPWKSTPFARTVIPAPSKAPMSEGSCKSSPRLPFNVASQPMVPSRGNLSTCTEKGT